MERVQRELSRALSGQGDLELTVLHWAGWKGYKDVVDVQLTVIENPSDRWRLISACDDDEETVLHAARGHAEIIRCVLGYLSMEERVQLLMMTDDISGRTVLHWCCDDAGYSESVKVILEMIESTHRYQLLHCAHKRLGLHCTTLRCTQ